MEFFADCDDWHVRATMLPRTGPESHADGFHLWHFCVIGTFARRLAAGRPPHAAHRWDRHPVVQWGYSHAFRQGHLDGIARVRHGSVYRRRPLPDLRRSIVSVSRSFASRAAGRARGRCFFRQARRGTQVVSAFPRVRSPGPFKFVGPGPNISSNTSYYHLVRHCASTGLAIGEATAALCSSPSIAYCVIGGDEASGA